MCNAREEERIKVIEAMKKLGYSQKDIDRAVNRLNVVHDISADEIIRQAVWIREKTLNDYYSDMCNAREEGFREGREEAREAIIKAMKKLGYSQKDIDKAIGIS